MWRYLGKPDCPRVLFHNMPDYSFSYTVTPVFTRPTDTPEQSSGRDSGGSHPKVDGLFDPFGNRDGSNMAAFAGQIDYGPVFFALLQMHYERTPRFRRLKLRVALAARRNRDG